MKAWYRSCIVWSFMVVHYAPFIVTLYLEHANHGKRKKTKLRDLIEWLISSVFNFYHGPSESLKYVFVWCWVDIDETLSSSWTEREVVLCFVYFICFKLLRMSAKLTCLTGSKKSKVTGTRLTRQTKDWGQCSQMFPESVCKSAMLVDGMGW